MGMADICTCVCVWSMFVLAPDTSDVYKHMMAILHSVSTDGWLDEWIASLFVWMTRWLCWYPSN